MQLVISRNAQKKYLKLSQKDQQKIKRKLSQLKSNPYTGKSLEGKLAKSYSLRAWPYRIIYEIDKSNKRIWVTTILHRQGVYK